MIDGSVLGREPELTLLDGVVAAAEGPGATLVVVGDPGIGKSALLGAARVTAAEAGYAVLHTSGVESEMHLPFGGIHQVLAPLTRHITSLPKVHRDAVAAAFGLTDGTNPDLYLIAEAALAVLVRERVERPLVIVIDDAQWLDVQSHQILTFVAHRASTAGMTVIAATRPGHSGPFRDAGFPELQVVGVDDATAEAIVRSCAGGLSAAELKQVRREAQGNPLALIELPRSWGDGPASAAQPAAVSARLEEAFAGRVSDLPAGTRDLLLVAAVSSSSEIDEVLTAVSAFGTPDVSAALLDPAVVAGLVARNPAHIEFRHPLVRSGVLRRETLRRRHAAHAALADVLDADRYRQSWHRAWSIVGPDDQVAEALLETVPDSLRRGAVMSAVSGLERAAQLTSSSARRGERLMMAAVRAFEVGRADVVARLLRDVSGLDLSELDGIRAVWLAEAFNDDIRADPALVTQLRVSAFRADVLGDAGLALTLLLAAGLRCWWADSGADDRSQIVGVLDAMTTARADPRHLVAVAITEPVLRASEVMDSLAAAPLDVVEDGQSLRVYGMAAYAVGDLALATDLLDRAETAFRREGRLGMLPVVLALQLHIRLHLGDWAGADWAAREVVTISRETGQAVYAVNNILVEARALALRGDWQTALDVMADAEADAADSGVNDRICLAYQARGAALLAADRPDAAFACLRRQYDPTDPGYHLRESFADVALTAEAAVACGRADEARRLVADVESVAVLTPSPLLQVNLLYARAVLAPEATAEQRYREALAHDLTRWPLLRARLQLAYARRLVTTGRTTQAATVLEAAGEVFTRLGAAYWMRSAQHLAADIHRGGPA